MITGSLDLYYISFVPPKHSVYDIPPFIDKPARNSSQIKTDCDTLVLKSVPVSST